MWVSKVRAQAAGGAPGHTAGLFFFNSENKLSSSTSLSFAIKVVVEKNKKIIVRIFFIRE